MRIGTDYYPEHWPKERWKTDAGLMVKAHIRVIRVGEFAWSLYEPQEGRYEFRWMDEALDFFGSYGIRIVLCTPSATPPKWMVDKYPEIYQEDIHGRPKLFGTRKHYCFNSRLYREKTAQLVERIAKRYGDHPALEGWQVDNELGWSNTTRCYCDKCQGEFRRWLEEKYGKVEKLNKAYGTVFWSQVYNSFEEVILPRAGACYDTCHDTQGQNPALLLDYYRFASDSAVSFAAESAQIIKRYSDRPVTTNLLDAAVNSGTGIDYFKLAKELDFVTWDNYVEFQWGTAQASTVSRDHALLRSYKKRPFWVMEQQSGPCGWSKMGPSPTPGKLRLWTFQAVANGADTVVYFRWRACPFGTEQYWHGILGHDGRPGSRYEEIAATGEEMERLSAEYGPLMPKAEAAIVKSFDSEWSHSIHKHVEGFQYDELLLSFYRPFYEMGIAADFVQAREDLSGYRLVVAPALIMADEKERRNLERYVQAGGRLLLTFRSGVKDENNNMLTETVPGSFRELTGVEVRDYDPQLKKQTKVSGVFGQGAASLWCDVVTPLSAESLGTYTQDYYAGEACFTVNRCGKGRVYYLGCDLDGAALSRLIRYLSAQADIPVPLYELQGVETVKATDGSRTVYFLLNHNSVPAVCPLTGCYKDRLTGRTVRETVTLAPYGVAILAQEEACSCG